MSNTPPIGNHLSALRKSHGNISQAELAKAIGMSRQSVNAIEKGHYAPSLECAFRLSHIFKVSIHDIFYWHTPEYEHGNHKARNGAAL